MWLVKYDWIMRYLLYTLYFCIFSKNAYNFKTKNISIAKLLLVLLLLMLTHYP